MQQIIIIQCNFVSYNNSWSTDNLYIKTEACLYFDIFLSYSMCSSISYCTFSSLKLHYKDCIKPKFQIWMHPEILKHSQ